MHMVLPKKMKSKSDHTRAIIDLRWLCKKFGHFNFNDDFVRIINEIVLIIPPPISPIQRVRIPNLPKICYLVKIPLEQKKLKQYK